jgi:hypothetical protein
MASRVISIVLVGERAQGFSVAAQRFGYTFSARFLTGW